jgi:hypothetical protein
MNDTTIYTPETFRTPCNRLLYGRLGSSIPSIALIEPFPG